jgi:prolyl-tRNA synthetase
VLTKIENIIRRHMDKIGNELVMPALAPKENWEKTGRLESLWMS